MYIIYIYIFLSFFFFYNIFYILCVYKIYTTTTTTEQLDKFRMDYLNKDKLKAVAAELDRFSRILLHYARSDEGAQDLVQYIKGNKKYKARMNGKDGSVVVGGWGSRWTIFEHEIIFISLLFVNNYGGGIGWGYLTNPTSRGNVRILHHIMEALIMKESLDVLYGEYIRSRSIKSLRDRLIILGGYDGEEPIMNKIRKLLEKLGYKEPKKHS